MRQELHAHLRRRRRQGAARVDEEPRLQSRCIRGGAELSGLAKSQYERAYQAELETCFPTEMQTARDLRTVSYRTP
jgi:hypothetical protein